MTGQANNLHLVLQRSFVYYLLGSYAVGMKNVPLCLLLCCLCSIAQAAPDPPFEDLLRRAETVFIARVTSVNGDHTITVESTEILRGKCDTPLTLPPDRFDIPIVPIHPGAQFFCLSQGDAKLGPPRPVFGWSDELKFSWRGWMTLPIKRVEREVYVLGVYSHVDGHRVVDSVPEVEGSALTLSRIKQLIGRFPYGSVRADTDRPNKALQRTSAALESVRLGGPFFVRRESFTARRE